MENQAAKKPTVLIFEPDSLLGTAMSAVLESAAMTCQHVKDPVAAVREATSQAYDLLVYAVEEDVLATAEQVAALRRSAPAPMPVIFVASKLDASWIEPLNAAGGVYCLTRPFEPARLIEYAREAISVDHISVARSAPPKAHFSKDWVRL